MRLIITLLLFALCVPILPIAALANSEGEQNADNQNELRLRVYKRPMAPAPFSLMDHNGRAFTAESLKGQWSIVFLGYTNCADICPTTLASLNKVSKKLPHDAERAPIQIVFVSVDPHRDTLPRLKDHVAFFNPAFAGVTGSIEELQQFAFSLGAFFDYRDRTTRKVIKNIAERPQDDDYIVGHAADLLVFNPEGLLAGVIFPPHAPDHILAALEQIRSGEAMKQNQSPSSAGSE